MSPYYQDDMVTLYHGDMFELLPSLGQFDACITDPPFGQTPLAWDRWAKGWPLLVAEHTSSLWCFGTMRMLLDHQEEFKGWKFAQDVVWSKAWATSRVTDRFRRQHELITHWYRGAWGEIYHDLPKVPSNRRKANAPTRNNSYTKGASTFGQFPIGTWKDDGLRYMTSVLEASSVAPVNRRRLTINPTQKPLGVLEPLVRYACPAGGTVLDPFAGSGTTAIAARRTGRRALLIEAREEQCELTAKRLGDEMQTLDLEGEAS